MARGGNGILPVLEFSSNLSKWDWCLNVSSSQLCIKLLRIGTVYNHDGVTEDAIYKRSRYSVDFNLKNHKYQLWKSCEAI